MWWQRRMIGRITHGISTEELLVFSGELSLSSSYCLSLFSAMSPLRICCRERLLVRNSQSQVISRSIRHSWTLLNTRCQWIIRAWKEGTPSWPLTTILILLTFAVEMLLECVAREILCHRETYWWRLKRHIMWTHQSMCQVLAEKILGWVHPELHRIKTKYQTINHHSLRKTKVQFSEIEVSSHIETKILYHKL